MEGENGRDTSSTQRSDDDDGSCSTIGQCFGSLLIALGLIDYVLGEYMDTDLTGVSWSPIAFGVAGSVFSCLGVLCCAQARTTEVRVVYVVSPEAQPAVSTPVLSETVA
eukprot:CAMPEP_0203756722 /NCGR_PEP_ID=MMETSP0098-20131031/9943_1 /ASSEMBLY_ACC=CAM_ASM_000208 /TAXON_ID=96639 /ORGANISM=" , Strain NY0313808BC1" /LENGTH=108 /DNA_ID=CAMNT_0050648699 /DNA_START=66 /DNA_END=389 /DNA_ORIENTATION=+